MALYSAKWKLENGYYDANPLRLWSDERCDFIEREKSAWEQEQKRLTPHFWKNAFPQAFPVTRYDLPKLDKEDVRAKVDMVNLYLLLYPGKKEPRRISSRYVQVSCPLHGDDKLPSMSLDTQLKRYNCHACGEKGDCFDLYRNATNCSFPDAVRALNAL